MTETQHSIPPKTRGTAKPALPRFLTLADLLREAYSGKKKRLSIAKVDIESMQSCQIPEGDSRQELLQRASSDRTLERSRELLLLCAEKLGRHPLGAWLKDFVREVLRRHPAYQLRMLDGVLENLPDAAPMEFAVKALTTQPFSQLSWGDGSQPLKKSEIEMLRQASAHCLILWLRESRSIQLDRILPLLKEHCWAGPEGRPGNDAKQLRTLMSSRDRKALNIVFSSLETKVNDKNREATAARDGEQRMRRLAERTQASLNEANQLLEVATGRTDELTEQLQREKQRHANDVAHMRSDYEELRGRVLHRLRQEVTLLDEGLHALRKEPPKVHVMEDHAERAIDGLKKEIAKIKGEAE